MRRGLENGIGGEVDGGVAALRNRSGFLFVLDEYAVADEGIGTAAEESFALRN